MKAKFLGFKNPGSTVRETREGFTIGKVYDVEKSGSSWLVIDDDGNERARPESDFEPCQWMLYGVVYRIVGDCLFHYFAKGTRVVLFKDDGDGTFEVVSLSDSGPRSQWVTADDIEVDEWQHL